MDPTEYDHIFRKLDAFDRWMVRQNIEHARTEGLAVVVARLKANGYPDVAAAVEAVRS